MSWERNRGQELLAQATQRIAAGQHGVAMATLCRAFDLLTRGDVADDLECETLRLELLVRMHLESVRSGHRDAFVERAVRVFHRIAAKDGIARDIVDAAVRRRRTGPEFIEMYLRFLEVGGDLDGKPAEQLARILRRTLRVSRRAHPEDVRHLVPLLERLARARPDFGFPLLYLARFRTADGDHAAAEACLARIHGELARTPKVLVLRARVAEKRGRIADALHYYEQALACDEAVPELHYRAGRLALWAALAAGDDEDLSAAGPDANGAPARPTEQAAET